MNNLAYVLVDKNDCVVGRERTYRKAERQATRKHVNRIVKVENDGRDDCIIEEYYVVTKRDMLIQKLFGLVFIILSIIVPMAADGDATVSLFFLPAGLFLLFTKNFYLCK